MGGQRFGVLDSCFLHLYLSSIFSSNGDLKMIEPLKAIYDVGQIGAPVSRPRLGRADPAK